MADELKGTTPDDIAKMAITGALRDQEARKIFSNSLPDSDKSLVENNGPEWNIITKDIFHSDLSTNNLDAFLANPTNW